MEDVYHILGLVGVTCILLAYFLLQTKKVDVDNIYYILLNIFGPSLIILSLVFEWNLPSFIIEVFWLLISLFSLWKSLFRRKRPNSDEA